MIRGADEWGKSFVTEKKILENFPKVNPQIRKKSENHLKINFF